MACKLGDFPPFQEVIIQIQYFLNLIIAWLSPTESCELHRADPCDKTDSLCMLGTNVLHHDCENLLTELLPTVHV